MNNNQSNLLPPWASGPAEILEHGLDLLRKESDANRRLAMISIDNAVELIIKTYLGLPKRVTGLKIARAEYQDFSESFPKLLDALEKYGASKLGSLDLGEIEWYHRLRNQLYHQGNGLTVERIKVEIYGQLAVALFENLFDTKLPLSTDKSHYLLAEFISAWATFERTAHDISNYSAFNTLANLRTPIGYANEFHRDGYLSKSELEEIKELWATRNQAVHGHNFKSDVLTVEKVNRIKQLTKLVQERIMGK
jgi:hypothetical protein